jgi:peroxiredoxin (alkyl hydroperoxide reductase subunit C)
MQAYQQQLSTLEGADTQVLGVSMDSPFANKAWAQQIGVTFPLLSDLGGEITRQYGVFNPKYKAARRVTYLIGKDGKVLEMQKDSDAIDPAAIVTTCQRRKMKT